MFKKFCPTCNKTTDNTILGWNGKELCEVCCDEVTEIKTSTPTTTPTPKKSFVGSFGERELVKRSRPSSRPLHNPEVCEFCRKYASADISYVITDRPNNRRFGEYSPSAKQVTIFTTTCESWFQARITLIHEIAHNQVPSKPNYRGKMDRHGKAWKQAFCDLIGLAIEEGLFPGYEEEARKIGWEARASHVCYHPELGAGENNDYGL